MRRSQIKSELIRHSDELAALAREVVQRNLRRRRRPPEDPPEEERDPPTDPPPPRDRDREDRPPPRERPPVDAAGPIRRMEITAPEKVHLEIVDDQVVHVGRGTTYASLRVAVRMIGPEHRGTIVVGVKGDGGLVQFGDENGIHPNHPLDISFVGLTPGATIGPLYHKSGDVPVEGLEFHGIGVVAKSDSFAFRQRAFIRRMILNEWWIKPLPGGTQKSPSQTTGWYCTKGWDLAVFKGYQPEGSGALAQFSEHVIYPKPGGDTQYLDNDMRGHRRCFSNQRPHGAGIGFGASPKPRGHTLWDGNVSDGAGWDAPTDAPIAGGALMTCYASLEYPVQYSNNEVVNCRMGVVMCGRGASNTNPYLTPDGYSFSSVYLIDNDLHCDGSLGSDPRHCVNVADIPELVFAGTNKFRSEHRNDLQLDSAGYGSRSIADVRVLGREAIPDFEKGAIWIAALGKSKPFTMEDLLVEVE